jgi:Domain of unknown function (DUF4189)
MRRLMWAAAVLTALACLDAAPALAGWGAIAWDPQSGKSGWIWDQQTPKKAIEMALSQCGASGCRIVIKPTTACAALAATADGKAIGAAARKTQDAARLAALSDCQKRRAGDCAVRASDCNK